MIDKPLDGLPFDLPKLAAATDLSVDTLELPEDIGDLGEPTFEENEDGSLTINFTPEDDEPQTNAFTDNLADFMDDSELQGIGNDLLDLFEEDLNSRKAWEETYKKGLDLLGVKIEDRTKPWPGACGVYHPVLMEAVVRFQAQTMMELFPPNGPAKTKIMGDETPELMNQADRVKNELNYILVDQMEDYRDETEALLFRLAIAGSAFRKVYYDPATNLPCAKFVPAEDLVVSSGETSLRTCSRVTYIDNISINEFKRRQVSKFYRAIDLDPVNTTLDRIRKKENDLTGINPQTSNPDRYSILEFHVDYDIDVSGNSQGDEEIEIALPYIIHVERESGKVLAIYRNWNEGDKNYKKKNYFVHYKYVPGLGFYGFGLIHIIGGLAKSGTGILRQLVDAGTLSNLPGGLKSRGLRIKGDDSPIRPGEFRDVDVMGGDIAKNITFLPYKEPSNVLYQLLGNLVDEARRVGSIADMNVGDMKQEAPVGTTLALMERAMKVMSAIQARCHSSLQQELRLIGDVVKNFMGPQYVYNSSPDANRTQDFSSVNIVPVSDPGATTMSQRVVQYQAVIQLASQNPQIYDMRRLNLDMLNVLGIKDAQALIPDPSQVKMADPITENMNLLKGSAAKAFQEQDHEAHIQVHMSMVNDPAIKQFISQTPQAAQANGAMMAHIAEHMAFKYRNDIEKQLGVQLPPMGEQLPPDVENHLSSLVATAAAQVLEQSKNKVASDKAEEAAKDPIIQLQQRELDIKESAIEAKRGEAAAKITLDAHKADQSAKIQMAQIMSQKAQSNERIAAQRGEAAAQIILDTSIADQNAKIQLMNIASQHGQSVDRATLEVNRMMLDGVKKEADIKHAALEAEKERMIKLSSKAMDLAGKMPLQEVNIAHLESED
jgi:hypothetical protein